jgi:hypothetical protein
MANAFNFGAKIYFLVKLKRETSFILKTAPILSNEKYLK